MGRKGIFINKILISLLDGQEKCPGKISREFDDLKQDKYYRKYCLELSKKGILDKKVKDKIKEKYFKNKNLESGSRIKEYNLYKIVFDKFIIFLLDKLKNYFKRRRINIEFSKEDIELLKRYYSSEFFKREMIQRALNKVEIIDIFIDSLRYFEGPREFKLRDEELIRKMEEFYNKYFILKTFISTKQTLTFI